MISKAFDWIKTHGKPEIVTVGNRDYSDRTLYPVNKEKCASFIKTSTLTSLVDYVRSDIDDIRKYKEERNQLIVHVVSPTQVRLYGSLNGDKERDYLMEVNAQLPAFNFDTYYDLESFNIALQSKFIRKDWDDPEEDLALLLKFTGTAQSGTLQKYGDDGVSQQVTVQHTITSKDAAIVPNPVNLKPYSTFREVEQPNRLFVFRMNDKRGELCAAIFEADGGAWKDEAMRNMHQYLTDELSKQIEDGSILLIQ